MAGASTPETASVGVGNTFENTNIGMKFKVLTESGNTGTVELVSYTGTDSSLTIPKEVTDSGVTYTVTIIGGVAFSGCTSLTSITIPNSVTSINYGAFSGCTNLASITIPNSVISIDYGVFSGCTSLKSIIIPDSVTSIGDGAFEGCTSLASITISKEVTSIGTGAFENCVSLASVTIPDGVDFIGGNAFKGCKSLTSITIPNRVSTIREYAFQGCSSLASVTISNGLRYIETGAFEDCTSLTSITIPANVTNIGMDAFKGCTSLKTAVLLTDAEKTVNSSAFDETSAEVIHKYVAPANLRFDGTTVRWDPLKTDYVSYKVVIGEVPSSSQDIVENKKTYYSNDGSSCDLSDYMTKSGTYHVEITACKPMPALTNKPDYQDSETVEITTKYSNQLEISDVQATRTGANTAEVSFTASMAGTMYYKVTELFTNEPQVSTDGEGIAVSEGSNTFSPPLIGTAAPHAPQYLYVTFKTANGVISKITEITIPAYSDTVKYTVTYDANGGTGTAPTDSIGYYSGDRVYVMYGGALSREGYTFKGWNTAADGSGTAYAAGSNFKITANTTLYAVWEQDTTGLTLTLKYAYTTGNTVYAPGIQDKVITDIAPGTVIDLTNYWPSKLSWEDSSGQTYYFYAFNENAGGGNGYDSIKMTQDTTLYAGWSSRSQVTITFDTNGGSLDYSKTRKDVNDDLVTLNELYAPTREGYTFLGWSVEDDGTADDIYTKITQDTTLYAVWEQETTGLTLTLKFDYTDGHSKVEYKSGIQDTVITGIAPGTEIDLSDYWPSKLTWEDSSDKTYHFSYFYENASGGNGYHFIEMTQDTTLYAGWSTTPYITITFDLKGGSMAFTKIRDNTSTPVDWLNAGYIPTREGYTFLGWSEEDDDSAKDDKDTRLDQDTTLYAVWKEVPDIQVGQVTLKSGEYTTNGTSTTTTKPASGGYAYYENGVLTLNNFSYSGGGKENNAVIYADQDLSIVLVGSSSITTSTLNAIRIDGHKLGISGGSLNLTASDEGGMGIYLLGTGSGLTIENAALTISGGYYGIYSPSDGTSLMISDADLDIKVENQWGSAIFCDTTVIKNSEVKLASPRIAIKANDALTIENSTVDAEGFITSNDDKTVTFTSGHLLVSSDSEYGAFYSSQPFASLPTTYWWRTSADGDWTKSTEAAFANNKQTYVEITTDAPLSSDASVTALAVGGAAGQIDGTAITVTLPEDAADYPDAADFVITAAQGAQTSLPATTDGGKTWEFTVTAEDGTKQDYTIVVNRYHDVTLRADKGTASASPSRALSGTPITLTAAPNPGYRFDRWETQTGGVSISENRFVMPDSPVTVTAVFAPNTYTITYVLDDGTNAASNPETYTVEDAITLADPTRQDYDFQGWYLDSGFTQKVESIPAGTTGSLTLYAKWERRVFTITFNPTGGFVDPDSAVTETDGTLDRLPKAWRANYVFKGWYTARFGGRRVTRDTVFTEDTTVYARWERYDYDSDSPKTGDTTRTELWLGLACLGAAGLLTTLLGRKYLKKRK